MFRKDIRRSLRRPDARIGSVGPLDAGLRRRRRRWGRHLAGRMRHSLRWLAHSQLGSHPSVQHGPKPLKLLLTDRSCLVQRTKVGQLRIGRQILREVALSPPAVDQGDYKRGQQQRGDEAKTRHQQLHRSLVSQYKGKNDCLKSRHACLARALPPWAVGQISHPSYERLAAWPRALYYSARLKREEKILLVGRRIEMGADRYNAHRCPLPAIRYPLSTSDQ